MLIDRPIIVFEGELGDLSMQIPADDQLIHMRLNIAVAIEMIVYMTFPTTPLGQ